MKRHTKEADGPRPIEILARGVCVKGGRLLVCHTVGAVNTFLPGGHVEFREGARAALEREIREELGVRATADRFLGCVEHAFLQKGVWHAEINLVFELRIPGVTAARPPPACEGWIDFRWVPLARLRAARLEPAALIRHLPRWLRQGAGFADFQGWAQRDGTQTEHAHGMHQRHGKVVARND
jgi:8-oxo-dGTP pyrophosphatase MutT (NUDIX family)